MAAGHNDKKIIIIASVIGGSAVALVIIIYSLLFWRSRKEGYKLLLGAEQSTSTSILSSLSGV
jgi:flagellar biosynthesis/type III secretory pathway M-ring protein FliF/YscJ